MWLFFPQGRHFFETPSSSRGGGLFLVTLFGGSPTAETPVVFVYAKDSLVSNEYKYVEFCAAAGGNTLV